ncbi:MAG TPA: hypothetical protein VNZ45_12390 [Bacteroidia bacterium]|jgi:hypothetical protein|nr:hypothetical protein [Bacteroidia bacterium]
MKKTGNKHLGMDQDELAASFAGRLKSKKKAEMKEESLGLSDAELAKWNKKLSATLASKSKKKKLA